MRRKRDDEGSLPRAGKGRAGQGGAPPERTCVGCRRTRPQALLIRLVRTPDGLVEVDSHRNGGGRGAYVCATEACVAEANRRARWTRAFRGAAVLAPGTFERLRARFALDPEAVCMNERETRAGGGPVDDVAGRMGEPVEGGR